MSGVLQFIGSQCVGCNLPTEQQQMVLYFHLFPVIASQYVPGSGVKSMDKENIMEQNPLPAHGL